jgi:signal transduction histidine kinase
LLTAHVQGRLEAEKARIARRLHGDVAGMLAAARMDLSRLAGTHPEDAGVREHVARVDQILATVIQNAHAEMQRLHPALLDHFGLSAALRHLVEQACRAGGAVYTLELPDFADARVSAPVALAAYRAVEAWLAEGAFTRVTVCLREKSPYLLLQAQVERSESPPPGSGNDLLALRAWLEALDVAWTESNRGSVKGVQLVLPLQPAAVMSAAT